MHGSRKEPAVTDTTITTMARMIAAHSEACIEVEQGLHEAEHQAIVGEACIDCGEFRSENHEADCPARHDAYWCGFGGCPDERRCPIVGASCVDCGEFRSEGHEADCPAHHDAYWCGLGDCPDEQRCPHIAAR